MRVCLIATELFLWGKAGGYGRATRMIGRELARRGVEVCAVVPTPRGQPAQASLDVDGIRVLSFTPEKAASSKALYAQCDADIYHSQEATLGSYFAMRAMPDRKHLITFRDPRSWHDWWLEFLYPTRSKIQVASTCAYFENPFVRWAVRHADARFCAAHFLIDKVRRKFPNIPRPEFLPTPIVLPDVVEKAAEPTVCTVGRLDRRKRPEFVLEVARKIDGPRSPSPNQFLDFEPAQCGADERSLAGLRGYHRHAASRLSPTKRWIPRKIAQSARNVNN